MVKVERIFQAKTQTHTRVIVEDKRKAEKKREEKLFVFAFSNVGKKTEREKKNPRRAPLVELHLLPTLHEQLIFRSNINFYFACDIAMSPRPIYFLTCCTHTRIKIIQPIFYGAFPFPHKFSLSFILGALCS